MAYLTSQELGQLSAIPAAVLAAIDAPTVTATIEAASDDADAYLASRYRLPLVTYGHDLRQRVADIAAYRLMSRKGYRPGEGTDQDFRDRYDDAMAWLRDVAAGRATPQIVDTAPAPRSLGSVASATPRGW